jgi:hypothetical protein
LQLVCSQIKGWLRENPDVRQATGQSLNLGGRGGLPLPKRQIIGRSLAKAYHSFSAFRVLVDEDKQGCLLLY